VNPVTPVAAPPSDWTRRIAAGLGQLRQRESQLTLVLAVVIGALVGLVVVAFILLTGRLAVHLYPADGAPWRRAVVPVLGAIVSGYLLYRYFPGARGSGIPQTKAALIIDEGRISLYTVIGKFVCCTTSLASGIALGREGPSVQMGAGIASVIGRRLRLSNDQVKLLLPLGGAAALAAAFNTPIAAVLFTLEEIVGDMQAPVLGAVVVSSATAWMVLHLLLGDEPLFHVEPYQLLHPSEFVWYAALGVVGGLGSAAFVRLLLSLRRRFRRLKPTTLWWQPAVGGLVVGLMGYFVPNVMGVGYPVVEQALGGNMLLWTVVLLAVLKIVATAVCYASGNAGGIFGPSLFMGAMIGAAVGNVAHLIDPMHTAGAGAYALVGMGALFAGVVRTPLTSVIMIFEMTRDYAIIVPLMIANLVAFFISYKLQREPIYEALAHQDGIHLPTTEAHGTQLRVVRAMRPVAPGVTHTPETGHLHPDHTLADALERMASTQRNVLPVVSRADVSVILGEIALADVLRAYGFNQPSPPEP
jgi:CIC family chloride channel protein